MTNTQPPAGRTWLYRFARPGDIEIETREFNDDDAAETYARELSHAQGTRVVIERHDHVDWEYLTEVEARS